MPIYPANPDLFIRPSWAAAFSNALIIGQSCRAGGVSTGPFSSLNLGLYTADTPNNVSENRRRFAQALGIAPDRFAGSHQCHGSKLIEVEQPGQWQAFDALITRHRDVFLTVTVADCTPILIYAPQQQVVAAIHAGWRGTVARIVEQTLQYLVQRLDCDLSRAYAYIGACIGYDDFEVDADVADHFDSAFKRWDSERQKYFVDLKGANRAQLQAAGLRDPQIEVASYSTLAASETFFSHRAGAAGRGLAVIGLKSVTA